MDMVCFYFKHRKAFWDNHTNFLFGNEWLMCVGFSKYSFKSFVRWLQIQACCWGHYFTLEKIFSFQKQTFHIYMGNIIFFSANISSSLCYPNSRKQWILLGTNSSRKKKTVFSPLSLFFCVLPRVLTLDLRAKT